MMFGVMITSVVMENFSQMLSQLREFDVGYQEYEQLYLFIGTIQRLNNDQQIEELNQLEIVHFF